MVGYVRFIPERPGGCLVHSGAFDTFPCALGVVGCVRSIPVLWGSSCSFGCVWSITVLPGGRQVRSSEFGLLPCALGVIGFLQVR